MTELDFDTDAFLTLLTDALRAGPGSPAWHDALLKLRAGGINHADELKLLVTAREHLESGREYRSIKAGPGFAKRLMTAIDEDATRKPRTPTTTTAIALGSAGIMLVVLLVIGLLLWHASENPAPTDRSTLFLNSVTMIGGSGPVPSDWQSIGRMAIGFDRGGLAPAVSNDPTPSGGGATWQTPIDPDEPFTLAGNLRLFHTDENLIPQIFITDDAEFDPNNGSTSHELVWLLRGQQGRLLVPGGHVEAQGNVPIGERNVTAISITIDRDQAIVEMGGKRLWAGPHGLDSAKPRRVGVRFLRLGNTRGDGAAFESLRVNMRHK